MSIKTDLLDDFRRMRGQILTTYEPSATEPKKVPKRVKKDVANKENGYSKFLRKYANLEYTLDTFNASDLMFFFREKAGEANVRYVITNRAKDGGIFKSLLDKFDPYEICLMIEFLFMSNQTYLSKDRLSPNVLISGWCNKIYTDSQLWLEDKYVDAPQGNTREWSQNENETTELGGWE